MMYFCQVNDCDIVIVFAACVINLLLEGMRYLIKSIRKTLKLHVIEPVTCCFEVLDVKFLLLKLTREETL